MKSDRIYLLLLISLIIFVNAHQVYARGDFGEPLQKSFEVSPGGFLNLDTDRGSIEVKGTARNIVDIKVFHKMKNFIIEFDKRSNDIYITGHFEGGILDRIWYHLFYHEMRTRFVVTVPSRYHVDLKTSGSKIVVDELEGDLRSKTSGGSLHFEKIKGAVTGNTSGGSIELSESIGRAHLETSGGSINVQKLIGSIDAKTSGGSIKAQILKQPDSECRLTTSGGSVVVSLAEGIAVDVDAETSGGRVVTDFPMAVKVQGELKRSALKGKINGGGPLVLLRTSGGNIHIEKM